MLLLEREGFDGMAMEEAEACLYRGGTSSRCQDLSIWGLVMRKTRMHKKLWDFNKEGSRRHKRVDRARERLVVDQAASRWG